MTESALKYRLRDHLALMPPYINIEKILSVLDKHYSISREQFIADCAIQATSCHEIPVLRLIAYARVLSIPLESLLLPAQ